MSPLLLLIATPSHRCRCRRHRASIVSIALPPIPRCPIAPPFVHCDRSTAVHLALTATTTGDHQNAAEALLALFQEGTPNNESLIVGLDSLSIGDADENSMEDPLADGDAVDSNATDSNAADGDMEDGEAAMNGLRQMSQRLRFDILESFFDDFAHDIEWGGEDYDDTSLFDESGLAEGSDMENTNELGMAAGQEAANEEEESRRQLSQPPLLKMSE